MDDAQPSAEQAPVETTEEQVTAETVTEQTPEESAGSILSPKGGDETQSANEADSVEQANEEVVPDEYKFELPDGLALDEQTLASYEPVFKDLGLSNDKAQLLIDAYSQEQLKAQDEYSKYISQAQQQAAESIKADPVVGGDNFAKTEANINTVYNAFGTKFGDESLSKLKATLAQPTAVAMGNNLELVQLISMMGDLISSDTTPQGTNPSVKDTRTTAQKLYS